MNGSADLVGRIISDRLLKARWGYSELRSVRFGKNYAEHAPEEMLNKANQNFPFDQLNSGEIDQLIGLLHKGRYKKFADSVDGYEYRCEAWTKEQLQTVWALPAFNPPKKKQCIPYAVFLRGAPNTGVGGAPEDSDPRIAIQSIKPDAPFVQTEPVILIRRNTDLILLEGYLRSLLFMRTKNPNERLLAWVPFSPSEASA